MALFETSALHINVMSALYLAQLTTNEDSQEKQQLNSYMQGTYRHGIYIEASQIHH